MNTVVIISNIIRITKKESQEASFTELYPRDFRYGSCAYLPTSLAIIDVALTALSLAFLSDRKCVCRCFSSLVPLKRGKGPWKLLELKSKADELYEHKVLRICVVSGKPSRKYDGKPSKESDGNKFGKRFAWCLVLLMHVDIFGCYITCDCEHFAKHMGTMAMNETHASPTVQQSIETPVFTPNQTQQMGTETTNETPSKPNQAEENLNDEVKCILKL
ncbi:hypothetical protein F2Q68_00038667 [Brassica cretica]|uniref:Uncharacterized protein n=2 Tax=Brassica cretica TaxID=69181 RepID=A0ABQ7A544_BRACR|nr:hypothetical protein F2Q68_00038667 [Brassica cretica]KAF3492806.1 hypothetical protein DY000_02052223 [Brassica cretica]